MVPIKINDKTGKTNSRFFLHIMRAPKEGFYQSDLPMKMQILTNEQLYDVMLINFSRSKLNQITSIETYAAEGMDAQSFIDYFLRENTNYTRETEVATYIFKKA